MADRYIVQYDPKRRCWVIWDTQSPRRVAAMDHPVSTHSLKDDAVNRARNLNDGLRWSDRIERSGGVGDG